jgi:hypothetical protein
MPRLHLHLDLSQHDLIPWDFILHLSLLYNMSISLQSTIKLRSGAAIPQLGYGVYQARGDECEKGVAEALRVGYTHIDSAQAYRNEKREITIRLH